MALDGFYPMRDALSPPKGERPRLLDLFCCEGGAGEGYNRAGFDVTGVDHNPQPRNPHRFIQGDALEYLSAHGHEYDAIHASPPCQSFLNLTRVNETMGRQHTHVDLIAATRSLLVQTGKPYVIENVSDARAKLINPVQICGTSFGLPLRRHRLFESNIALLGTSCAHHLFTEPRYWTGWRPNGEHRLSTVVQVYGNAGDKHEWGAAMGIDWMSYDGMAEAVPPAYTEHIGAQLLTKLAAPQTPECEQLELAFGAQPHNEAARTVEPERRSEDLG